MLSPDDSRFSVGIAAAQGSSIWTRHLAEGTFSKLTSEDTFGRRPSWSRDGRDVLFVGPGSDGLLELHSARADGSVPATRLLSYSEPVEEAVSSHDGQWVVFRTGSQSGRRDILAIRPSVDSVAQTLVATDFDESAPALSPDDRWLAYVSTQSGQAEVYVRPFPIPPTGGCRYRPVAVEPVWGHNGQELFYKSGAMDLVAARLTGTGTSPPSVLDRSILFRLPGGVVRSETHAHYDVSRDDQRFLMVIPFDAASEGRGEIVLVEDWLDELSAMVPQ